MEPQNIWLDQCEATANIVNHFGIEPAMHYLIGEKFLDFLEAAAASDAFEAEVPAFAAMIKTIFEPSQLAVYLKPAPKSETPTPNAATNEPLVASDVGTDESLQDKTQSRRDLQLLLDRARQLLLDSPDD